VRQPWVWAWDDTPSDLSGGANFTDRVLRYAENQGDIQVDIPFNSTEADYFFTPANQPGNDDWPVGTWSAKVDVTLANARISLAIGLARVNGAGVFQQSYAATSVAQVLSSTGIKTFSGPTLPQTGAAAGDRLRILFEWTRDNSPGGGAGAGLVSFGFGDPAVDILTVPILMANPRIVWNGVTLDFPGPLTGYGSRLSGDRGMDRSDGVVHATSTRSSFRKVRMQLAPFQDITFWEALQAWWSWAVQGKQYSFALDSADVVDLLTSGAAAAGQKDIPIASTASIVAGRKYRIRSTTGHEEEVIQVDTITLNTKVTCLRTSRTPTSRGISSGASTTTRSW